MVQESPGGTGEFSHSPTPELGGMKTQSPSSGSVPGPAMIECWANLEILGVSTVWSMEPVETHSPGLGVAGEESWLETLLLWGKADYVGNGTTHSLGEQIPKAHQVASLGPLSSGK